MKAKDYFEEKKSNMRELWNLSDTQKEVMYSLMEQYVALHIADVSGCFSLARYINGYYEYSDNTKDGDIYMNVVTRKFMTETEIVKEWVRLNNR